MPLSESSGSREAVTIRYRLIRSRRRTTSITISPDAQVIVRAPIGKSVEEIDDFVRQKKKWILEKLALVQSRAHQEETLQAPTAEQILLLKQEAVQAIPPKVRQFARQLQVAYGRITIRDQKTRWGSCSSKGNLNFNCFLMRAPEEILDYVIVHELCHRKEMNHSAAFWALVGSILPDYRRRQAWLKKNGHLLMRGADLRSARI